MGWRGPVTDRQLKVWLAWRRMFEHGDKDLSMDGCVPEHIQKRWEAKVGGAQFYLQRGLILGAKARQIAKDTGEDEGVVYDRLKSQEQAA